MVRGLFTNKSVVNLLDPSLPAGQTRYQPTGEAMSLFDAAQRYEKDGRSVVIVAGERYGMGSSRDWAAKGAGLLNARAILAVGFERIHRSNLIGMGVLPVKLPDGARRSVWRSVSMIASKSMRRMCRLSRVWRFRCALSAATVR